MRENRRIATESILLGGKLVTPHQVHSPDVVTVIEPWDDNNRPTADALVTDRPGLVLGIVTADCAPVLMIDHGANVIGAAHAGWRGAHGGVLENTIAAMKQLGARPEKEDSQFFVPGREGHWQFDLPAYAKMRMARAGLTQIDSLGLDTYALEARYFSYRRATHRGEKTYGRQISLIALA